ncbi:MAG: hypothetical protein ACWGMY_04805 [Hyphomicrobiaceae bacterium]
MVFSRASSIRHSDIRKIPTRQLLAAVAVVLERQPCRLAEERRCRMAHAGIAADGRRERTATVFDHDRPRFVIDDFSAGGQVN